MDTILAADRDGGQLLLLETILREQGYSVLTAGDGLTARSLIDLRSGGLCAVVISWDLAGLSGVELVRWVKGQRNTQNLPVVMQTSRDAPEHIREGIEAGAFYYLTKPYDQQVLQSIVKAAVTDYRFREGLATKMRECENPFRLMQEGIFRFRTLTEAERMAIWIANASPSPDDAMQICEILINAVEHGNLGITYEEKTDFVDDGSWRAEIERRLALPENTDKIVDVEVRKSAGRMVVEIEDRGEGFNFRRYLSMDESRVFHNHGRGIAIANATLGLEYLGTGSRVRVTIPRV